MSEVIAIERPTMLMISDDDHLQTGIHLDRARAIADIIGTADSEFSIAAAEGLHKHTLSMLTNMIGAELETAGEVLDRVQAVKEPK